MCQALGIEARLDSKAKESIPNGEMDSTHKNGEVGFLFVIKTWYFTFSDIILF